MIRLLRYLRISNTMFEVKENIIYNELLCREYSVDVGVVEIVETSVGKR